MYVYIYIYIYIYTYRCAAGSELGRAARRAPRAEVHENRCYSIITLSLLMLILILCLLLLYYYHYHITIAFICIIMCAITIIAILICITGWGVRTGHGGLRLQHWYQCLALVSEGTRVC